MRITENTKTKLTKRHTQYTEKPEKQATFTLSGHEVKTITKLCRDININIAHRTRNNKADSETGSFNIS